ncbi:MAG: hypothetical protein ACHQM6_04120 [Candidatus Kapaibacterium sp.]
MTKLFYLAIIVLLGSAMCSCNLIQEASFTPPVISDFWYTSEPAMPISNGRIQLQDDHHGGHNQLPQIANVIVAWEMPNDTSRSLYVYGTGTISKIGYDNYTFTITIRDTLPKFVLLNKDTTNAIAAGHIFIVGNTSIIDGDTLHYHSDWNNSYQMIGSMNGIGIIFSKGNTTLAGKNLAGMPQGFNFLFATRWNFTESVTDFVPVYDPNDIEIQVDNDGHDCQAKTPLWLQ